MARGQTRLHIVTGKGGTGKTTVAAALALALADLDATVVIGGGETAALVEQAGLRDRYTHVSTGGGASLEFIEGRTLPGVAALEDKSE